MSTEINEKACVYAALILADEGQEVSADKLSKLISAAGLDVESIWPTIFAKALKGKDINDLIGNIGSASAVAAPAAAGGASGDSGAAAEEKKEEKKEEEEESDDDMGFGGLF
ncbi:hypothetical protein MIR68_001489 [Amoeboaphelidium protococcarum]|nr:hypothetical protein MIR68_010562 [Amoeboaphelidium protococcarum]KAI3640611.1 hypothetical protein MIR68_001489 [Amoeboaphelidium protococcarum]KAI3647682.1 hypothetical protein MP228_007903 [Amoeboaphelidium protococcarum]